MFISSSCNICASVAMAVSGALGETSANEMKCLKTC